MFPQLAQFTDLSLLLLRLIVAAVFVLFLGVAELAGGLGVGFGVLTQLAAIGLILVMLGAIQKKIFVWHTGFWGEKASGWHYDLMLVVMNIVIACSGGGKYVLWR